MNDSLPGLHDSVDDLCDLLEAHGARYSITPICDGEHGYRVTAEPRPPDPRFVPIEAESAREMRVLLDALTEQRPRLQEPQ